MAQPAIGDRVRYTVERDMKGKVLDICTTKNGVLAQVDFDMGETYWVDPDELEVAPVERDDTHSTISTDDLLPDMRAAVKQLSPGTTEVRRVAEGAPIGVVLNLDGVQVDIYGRDEG